MYSVCIGYYHFASTKMFLHTVFNTKYCKTYPKVMQSLIFYAKKHLFI